MDASILIVGDRDFLADHLQLVRRLQSCTIETASISDALSLIQAQQPDILLLQSSQTESLDLCQQIRSQNRLTWIYCILIEQDIKLTSSLAEMDAEMDVDSAIATDALLRTKIETEIRGLQAGADAVIWDISTSRSTASPDENVEDAHPDLPFTPSYSARVEAQIQAGLRRVQGHRELMRTNDLLSTIALTDPLTELNNRRAFEWELPRQIKNARATHAPISLLVLDVDFFKHINDNYGHLVGDRALHLLSARLRHNLRFCDIAFRYGGEEFVVILSGTDAREALLVAQRLCCLIAEQPFAINETLDLNITISAGTATLKPSDDERGISLLNRADQNLLQAKSQGRNRVVSSTEQGLGGHPEDFTPRESQKKKPNCNCGDSPELRT